MENVIIQSLGFKAGESLENYIREKMDKLTPNDQIVGANVMLFLGADRATPDTICEIRLAVPGNDLFVKEKATDDFYAAVDAAINKPNPGGLYFHFAEFTLEAPGKFTHELLTVVKLETSSRLTVYDGQTIR